LAQLYASRIYSFKPLSFVLGGVDAGAGKPCRRSHAKDHQRVLDEAALVEYETRGAEPAISAWL